MSNLHASTLLPRSHPSLHTSSISHSTSHHSNITSLPSPRVLLRSHPTVLRLDVATRSVPRSLSSTVAAMLSRPLRAVVTDECPLSFAATLTLHMHIASRPAVRAAVVMRPAHASADRDRRRSRRRDQVRTRFASAVEQRCFQPWRLSVSWLVATPPRRGASALTAHQHAAGARRHAAITIASQHYIVSLTPQ